MKRIRKGATLFNRAGVAIDSKEFKSLMSSETYRYSRRYGNDKIRITAEWVGKVPNAAECPREFWALYKVTFSRLVNLTQEGSTGAAIEKWIEDPMLSKTMATEKEAIEYYEALLSGHTRSRLEPDENGEMKMVEYDNNWGLPELEEIESSTQVSRETLAINPIAGSW